ncbi:MAG TPA: hypothetical protein VG405_04105 [Solirubrobacteraceae bacterium]|jgi:hypothetical protein|nr:hypothetical protein [Solirubrobacteraceae bacterium]
MATQAVAPSRTRFGATERKDDWWRAPLITVIALTAFGIYSIVILIMGSHFLYTKGGAYYLSPFYSPDIRSWGVHITVYGFFVAWVPAGFRITCYYYRKAYWRSFFLSPPACAVEGPRGRRYQGERKFPFILLNAHRFFLYLSLVVVAFLWYDAGHAFVFRDPDGSHTFGVGVGSLLMLLNVILLSGFTFGCNSLRHLVGGRLDCFTCSGTAKARHRTWLGVNVLNRFHMQWAWVSLCSVALTDLYIRLASVGVFTDPRIIH